MDASPDKKHATKRMSRKALEDEYEYYDEDGTETE